MTKIHFRPYTPKQTVLFPQRIDEDIAANDAVRMVDALVESLNLESFRKLYKECGRSPYHPKMMLKVILFQTGMTGWSIRWLLIPAMAPKRITALCPKTAWKTT